MKKTSLWNPLLLLLTAAIWGTAFVAQSVGMDYLEPFTFNFVRSIIGGIVLLPCIAFLDKQKSRESVSSTQKKSELPDGEEWSKCGEPAGDLNKERRTLVLGGVCCGAALFVASSLQQIGIQYTTVGKAGFITAMYIILVPVFGIFRKKKVGAKIWLCVLLAVAGLYLLCITEGITVGSGDLLVLLCAAAFAVHILIIDHFSPLTDGVRLSCIQFFVCGLLSGVGMLLFEAPSIGAVLQAWLPIGYAGVLSCGVAYTLQIVAQKGMDPTVASLILSMESVFSVLSGWLLLGQSLAPRELSGCVLMFAAIILAQLPEKRKRKQESR
ncbi:MAG: DMT family transporter [Lachnospiraceae bacterium]|nr:DMT family transporter [Lachnospiraceae bacterium]